MLHTMQQLGNSIVALIYSGVAQTFDQELWVPGQLGTEAIGSCTCPFVQPIQDGIEGIARLFIVCVHSRNQADKSCNQ
jgi:hypothetical protein